MLEKSRKLVDGWVGVLALRGVNCTVDRRECRVRLGGSALDVLLLGDEEVPLVNLALHLDGKALILVASSHVSDRPKRFHLELDDADAALELAVTLRVLRAAADTGGGVLAWSSRGSDRFRRPAPVE